MTPEITVIIPTRDRCRLLFTALASALRQQDVELEIIVVDDGSRDETNAPSLRASATRVFVYFGIQPRLESPKPATEVFGKPGDPGSRFSMTMTSGPRTSYGCSSTRPPSKGPRSFSARWWPSTSGTGSGRRLAASAPNASLGDPQRNVVPAPQRSSPSRSWCAKSERVRHESVHDRRLGFWIRLAAAGTARRARRSWPATGYTRGTCWRRSTHRELRGVQAPGRQVRHRAARIRAHYSPPSPTSIAETGAAWRPRDITSPLRLGGGDCQACSRALGVLLGERAMALPGRKRGRQISEPEWLHPPEAPNVATSRPGHALSADPVVSVVIPTQGSLVAVAPRAAQRAWAGGSRPRGHRRGRRFGRTCARACLSRLRRSRESHSQ